MLSTPELTEIPGFFGFRWETEGPNGEQYDISVVYKVPGAINEAVLPDLIEEVCRGPIVPDAVVIVHFDEDEELVEALSAAPTMNARVRFKNRLPLFRASLISSTLQARVSAVEAPRSVKTANLKRLITSQVDAWLAAGLESIFKPAEVVVQAPPGYAYKKPSQGRSSHFIRAEQGLTTSSAVSLVALAVLHRLIRDRKGVPDQLRCIYIDTMAVSMVAYALRELLRTAGVRVLPQVESFHSYDGIERIPPPLPGTALCLISASSSMNLHREWVRSKRVLNQDVLTLLTYEDAKDAEFALHLLPAAHRPESQVTTARHDISIKGENFVAASGLTRSVLLRKPIHGFPNGVEVFNALADKDVFSLYRSAAAGGDGKRRGLHVDGFNLINSDYFSKWLKVELLQRFKASTRYVVFQEDDASEVLAGRVADFAKTLGLKSLMVYSASEASERIKDPSYGLIAVAAVVGDGSRMLNLSRSLRGKQTGPRLYLIGAQVTESSERVQIFDRNLMQSTHRAAIEIRRRAICCAPKEIAQSFDDELRIIYRGFAAEAAPTPLKNRARVLREVRRAGGRALMPTGQALDHSLSLRLDFAFWEGKYSPGAYEAAVIGTVSQILQRARESSEIPAVHRLSSPMLDHVLLDPENFARFDDGLIQAALLRSALPFELDYRGNMDASSYLREFLKRMARDISDPRAEASLEFLTAMLTGRLRIEPVDQRAVAQAFMEASRSARSPLSRAIRFLSQRLASGQKASPI